jgi:hypothetical protein
MMIVRGNRRPGAWRDSYLCASLSNVSPRGRWHTCTTESILELAALGDFVASKSGSGLPVDGGVVFPPTLMGAPAIWRDNRLNVALERKVDLGGGEVEEKYN